MEETISLLMIDLWVSLAAKKKRLLKDFMMGVLWLFAVSGPSEIFFFIFSLFMVYHCSLL